MQDDNGLLGWVLAGVGTVISTLSGIVAYFYRTQITDFKSREVKFETTLNELAIRADKCESDREELRVHCAVMDDRLKRIEEKVTGSN